VESKYNGDKELGLALLEKKNIKEKGKNNEVSQYRDPRYEYARGYVRTLQ
jgi:hypothetical protein